MVESAQRKALYKEKIRSLPLLTTYKINRFKKIPMFVIFVTLLFPLTIRADETSGAELVNLLNEKDQISSSAGYIISFLVSMQYNPLQDSNQGMVFMDSKATWTQEGAFAMKITYNYKHPPIFVPPTPYSSYDYDDNGNLGVVRPMEEYILSEPNRNDSLQKVKRFIVDPNGQIVSTDDHETLWRWPIDKPYSTHQFNHFKIAMGRGFSRHLSSIDSKELLPSGLLKITSQGSNGPGFKGKWELILDPNSDYLVRQAVFTPDGMNKPLTVVTSNGVIAKDRIKLAKYGVLKYSNLPEYSIEVTDISKVAGPNTLYEEVISILNKPLPAGTSIVDLRGEEPVRTTVE